MESWTRKESDLMDFGSYKNIGATKPGNNSSDEYITEFISLDNTISTVRGPMGVIEWLESEQSRLAKRGIETEIVHNDKNRFALRKAERKAA